MDPLVRVADGLAVARYGFSGLDVPERNLVGLGDELAGDQAARTGRTVRDAACVNNDRNVVGVVDANVNRSQQAAIRNRTRFASAAFSLRTAS